MIQVVKFHIDHFCFFNIRKCDFFQIDSATIHVVEWHLIICFCLLTRPKFELW